VDPAGGGEQVAGVELAADGDLDDIEPASGIGHVQPGWLDFVGEGGDGVDAGFRLLEEFLRVLVVGGVQFDLAAAGAGLGLDALDAGQVFHRALDGDYGAAFDVLRAAAAVVDADSHLIKADRRLHLELHPFECGVDAEQQDPDQQEVGRDVIAGEPADHGLCYGGISVVPTGKWGSGTGAGGQDSGVRGRGISGSRGSRGRRRARSGKTR
jgi:hypothetical protein